MALELKERIEDFVRASINLYVTRTVCSDEMRRAKELLELEIEILTGERVNLDGRIHEE